MSEDHGNNDPLMARLLSPLSSFYESEDTVEMRMVKPGSVITDRRGRGKKVIDAPDLTLAAVEIICKALSNRFGLKFDVDEHPKLSCVLPGGHRFECLLGASVQSGLSMAIRCKHPFTPTWQQLGVTDMVRDYLIDAVDRQKNIIVSGATNTGKTTLLNKAIDVLPDDRRLIAVEDTPELQIGKFWDSVGLLAERETSGSSGMVTYRELYDHKMRITPDQIIFGEISTLNAFAFLSALNSGAEGVMCSIHGKSPHQVIHRKFDQNIAWAGETMPNVPELLMELIDVIVQIKRSPDGWRRISDIYEPINDRFVFKDGKEVLP
ncbi:MAG: Flp pilus assembly complex ATPase component TadA [Alphaproteobacteria bacterium]|nr:Flp pilus assembly complex ATPase component TadA [Alphaproteobacteria bacterium]